MPHDTEADLFELAKKAAPDENRLMPTERTYLKTSQTVSLNEALSGLKRRKKHPEEIISGGLDDTSDSVKIRQSGSRTSGTVNQTGSDTDEVPDSDSVQLTQKTTRQGGRRQQKDHLEKAVSGIEQRLDQLQKTILELKASLSSDNKMTDRPVLEKYMTEKHRVTFRINGMQFTVPCLGMVRNEESHTLVIVFSDESDNFFVPNTGSELFISYDGSGIPSVLYYFGMTFTLKDLGLKFIGFLTEDSPVGESSSHGSLYDEGEFRPKSPSGTLQNTTTYA